MARIPMTSGFTLIPEGTYVFRVYGATYDEEFGKIEVKLVNAHGDKSVILLSQHLTLTEEEVMCILYHMGAFTEKEHWGKFTNAVNRFPNVLWTHHADMIASQVVGV